MLSSPDLSLRICPPDTATNDGGMNSPAATHTRGTQILAKSKMRSFMEGVPVYHNNRQTIPFPSIIPNKMGTSYYRRHISPYCSTSSSSASSSTSSSSPPSNLLSSSSLLHSSSAGFRSPFHRHRMVPLTVTPTRLKDVLYPNSQINGTGTGTGASSSRSRFTTNSKLQTSSMMKKVTSMRAPRIRWTTSLHARFVHAVDLLGGQNRTFFLPFLILETSF